MLALPTSNLQLSSAPPPLTNKQSVRPSIDSPATVSAPPTYHWIIMLYFGKCNPSLFAIRSLRFLQQRYIDFSIPSILRPLKRQSIVRQNDCIFNSLKWHSTFPSDSTTANVVALFNLLDIRWTNGPWRGPSYRSWLEVAKVVLLNRSDIRYLWAVLLTPTCIHLAIRILLTASCETFWLTDTFWFQIWR